MAKGKIFSGLDYAVNVDYGKSIIQIPANAFELVVGDIKKLGKIPDGIKVIEIKEAK